MSDCIVTLDYNNHINYAGQTEGSFRFDKTT